MPIAKVMLLVHNGAMSTKHSPPPQTPPERRLTIPVSAAVHDTFIRIAKAGNMPVGRAMGEWLGDTLDAAEFMANKMEQARAAPGLVAREMHAYALGLTDITQDLLNKVRKGPESGFGSASAAHPDPDPGTRPPRPVIRGGNLPKNAKKQG